MKFGEQKKVNVFSITPLTFIIGKSRPPTPKPNPNLIDCKDEFCEANFNAFLKVYEDHLPAEFTK